MRLGLTLNNPPMSATTTQTHWIQLPASATHASGRLFAQSWAPATSAHLHPPIVMVHDSLGSVALWRDFPAQLAAATGRTVYAYDRLGYGQSDARTDTQSADFVAREAIDVFPQVRSQLGLDRYVLLGHSVGSGMVIEMAARAGNACQALITMAGQAFVEDLTRSGISAARDQFQDPEHLARLAKYHGDKSRWVVDAWTETWLSEAFQHWSVEAPLAQVTCPTLAIHGERDEYGSPTHAQRIANTAAGPAQAIVLPGIGHFPHREVPDVVLTHIARFLATV